MKLKGTKVAYSPAEKEMFALLTKKKQSTIDLAVRRYGKRVPFHGKAIVTSVLRSLSKKIVANDESFEVKRSDRNGPHPIEYWLS